MKNELLRYIENETGGFLLGYSNERCISVFEATDSGYQETIHETEHFAYDPVYEEHICTILSALYDPPLEVVGVWHKHNSMGEVPFSKADEQIHSQLLKNNVPCISLLFEMEDKEAMRYQVRVFWLSNNCNHIEITDDVIWRKEWT